MGLSDVWKKEHGDGPLDLEPKPEEGGALIGSVLAERYKIEKILSRGGMGVLYLASHLTLHKKFVIKMTLFEKTVDANQIPFQRFRREAHAMAQIHHPNVVEIVDYDVLDHRKPYIVMEFAEGVNLKTFMERNPKGLPVKTFLTFMHQITKGIAAIHKAGIVHRDLKPTNIHVTKGADGFHLKILDLGLAYYQDAETQTSHQKLTEMGEIIGTPTYMSPEQCMGEEVNYLSDVYNLGLIAYELLGGIPAVDGKAFVDVLNKQIREKPDPIQNASVPEYIQEAVFKALEKKPKDRFQSMEDFWQAISKPPKTVQPKPIAKETSNELPIEPVVPTKAYPVIQPEQQPEEKKLPWAIIGMGAVIVVLLVLLLMK